MQSTSPQPSLPAYMATLDPRVSINTIHTLDDGHQQRGMLHGGVSMGNITGYGEAQGVAEAPRLSAPLIGGHGAPVTSALKEEERAERSRQILILQKQV
jgi:hypothetical protein